MVRYRPSRPLRECLADDIVYAITVQALAGKAERPCPDLHGVGGITVATLPHHLRVLREAGLTRTRVSGKHRFLSLRLGELEQRFPGMITSVPRAGSGPTVKREPGGQPR